MNNATAQVDDPVFIGDNGTTSETAPTEPEATEPDVTSLDLRDIPEPDFQSLLAAPPPPPPPPTATKISSNTDSHVTLGSLAFRLFDTIENQIARDPHAATLSVMSARLDVIERAIAGSAGHSDTLVGLGERLDEIDRHIAAPDPHEASLSAINDRLAAVEHRLAAPHPHSGTIKSLVERLDEAEAKGSPRNLTAIAERLDMVERHSPSPGLVTQMTDRVVALEHRQTAPEVITSLERRFDDFEMRFLLVEEPAASKSGIGRRLFSLFVFLAVVVMLVTAVLVTVA